MAKSIKFAGYVTCLKEVISEMHKFFVKNFAENGQTFVNACVAVLVAVALRILESRSSAGEDENYCTLYSDISVCQSRAGQPA